ncbi:Pmp3 protein [Maudiozyma humilis]|uniref:Pmp3 protein n=1 Tax=Maudiozyma humilis TaxID=51915 RepID=A0AAV5RPF8_MAUHU|nr:Pmp3 protein [Kazachstania humilis]
MDGSKIINIILGMFKYTSCIVDIVLTICVWFPGMLYALYIVLKDD